MNEEKKFTGKLFLIPTPLTESFEEGSTGEEIKKVISGLNHFFAENIRTSRRFISSLKLGIQIEELKFYELNKDTSESAVEEYIKILKDGNDVGLMSEAGCPGIADPGSIAVSLAHKEDIQVVPMIGPSSILLALMASGFNGQSFVFHGYLPIDKEQRKAFIRKMEKEAIQLKRTQIFMETPYRNNSLFEDLLRTCEKETLLCLACDLTSKNEMIRTLPVYKWEKEKTDLNKKPTIFLIYR